MTVPIPVIPPDTPEVDSTKIVPESPCLRDATVMCAFAPVLRFLRHQTHQSQEHLALASRIDRSFMSQLERGIRVPTLGTLFRLAPVLAVSPAFIAAMTQARLKAMQDPAFDATFPPAVPECQYLASAHLLPTDPDIPTVMKALGIAVRTLRSRTRCTQVTTAARAGMDRSYLGDIECGHNNASLPMVLRLSNALGVSAEFLVHGVSVLIHTKLREAAFNTLVSGIPPMITDGPPSELRHR
jgi:transcriptional regulator with XRE-family HTH domain